MQNITNKENLMISTHYGNVSLLQHIITLKIIHAILSCTTLKEIFYSPNKISIILTSKLAFTDHVNNSTITNYKLSDKIHENKIQALKFSL